jgi:MerR family transcriptional regulator, light-induced transcriptional regulator
MASMRAFTESGGGWGGCGRDSFDFTTIEPLFHEGQHTPAEKRRKLLIETVKGQVIPRLSLSHSELESARSVTLVPTAEEIVEFVRLILLNDVSVASDFVENICSRGIGLQSIFLELFTPAARVLGELWEEDVCDFTDVTIALARLQQLLRELGAAFEIEAAPVHNGRKALLVAAPGDQHTFGVFMLQEFFRRAGWEVDGGALGAENELFCLVENEQYDVVGLSVSNDVAVDAFASVIRTVRKVVRSPGVHVIVGGKFFLKHPEHVSGVGADASAQDGRRAVLEVSRLLRTNALR